MMLPVSASSLLFSTSANILGNVSKFPIIHQTRTRVRLQQPPAARTFLTVVNQYEKGVTLTLGKLTSVKEPGLRIAIPIFQEVKKVDLRTRVVSLPPQEIITRDNVSANVSCVVYFKIVDPTLAVVQVEDVNYAVSQLVQTELRDRLCQRDFADALEQRSVIGEEIKTTVRAFASSWGAEIEQVQMKHIDLVDPSMVRALAKVAEASREKIAASIRADGELKAAETLVQAAKKLNSGGAMHLRSMQMIERISKEKSQHTIIVPTDLSQATTGLAAAAASNSANANKHSKKIQSNLREE